MSIDFTDFSFYKNMDKASVLKMAKDARLGKSIQDKINDFFANDDDKVVTNENEAAVLSSIFNGGCKPKMPGVPVAISGPKIHTCETKNADGTTTIDTIIDRDGDGFADYRTVFRYRYNNPSDMTERRGYYYDDNNFDGVPDNNKLSSYHRREGVDTDGREYTENMINGEKYYHTKGF